VGRRQHIDAVDAVVVLVFGDAELARWPLSACRRPDLGLVDSLARLQLSARRLGCSIQVHDACPELAGLLDLAGLAEILSSGKVSGQAEGGEEGGVEEVVMPRDPVA
jgi:hypothetical protein